MMYKIKTTLIAVFLTLMACILSAALLKDIPMTLYQPDGSKLDCLASGDEYHNWLHDKDNHTIIRDPKTGYLCYAVPDGENVKSSGIIAGRTDPAAHGIKAGINISESLYKEYRQTRFGAPASRNAPGTGTVNNIVVFIRFADESEFTHNISIFNGMFNTDTNSMKGYFQEASYNQLTVNSTFYPPAQNNTVVSWQDSYPRAYYQVYDATTNPQGYSGDDQRKSREFTLLQNAINGVSSSIPSNLVIDADNDGKVDNVVFIVSGESGAWNSLLWPHRWSLHDRYVYIHGKRVYDFNFQVMVTLMSRWVGLLCHEFFHSLGAPDLYHYTSNGIAPAGTWDLMESETNPPQHMTAYMKWKYGGWIDEIPVIIMGQEYTLNSLVSPVNNCFRINSNHPNQYYVVEYRKKTGTYESSIPTSGMLIYRIDTSAGNGNASGPPDELYVYRPGGTLTYNGSIQSAAYSLELGKTAINNNTSPTPFLADGSPGSLNISNIGSSSGNTITFRVNFPTVNFASNPHNEGFDGSAFPPDGWMNHVSGGGYSFERSTGGSNPNVSPQSGAGMAVYKSYSANADSFALLSSPGIICDDLLAYRYSFSFHMYRDTGYSTRADRIEIYLADTPDLSGNHSLLQTIHRYIGSQPIVSSAGWYQYYYELNLQNPGQYFVVFKAISAKGNNMYLDSISFSRFALPPGIAIHPMPEDGSIQVNPSPRLSWSQSHGDVQGYLLYLGTDNPPCNVINGQNLGLVNNYTYPGELEYLTQYYWKIVPFNQNGHTPACPVWSFVSAGDPGIASLPYYQDFDAVNPPDMPYGWTAFVSSNNPSAAVRITSAPSSYSASPPNCIQLSNLTDLAADLRLVSPRLLMPANGVRFSFRARGGSSGFVLQVGMMESINGDFELLQTITLSNQMVLYSISLADYSGSGQYIAFKHGLGGNSRNIYLDDIFLETQHSADLVLASFQNTGMGIIHTPSQFTIGVQNLGLIPASGYGLQLINAQTQQILASADISQSLDPLQSSIHTLSWTPSGTGVYQLSAKILWAGDANPQNNISPMHTFAAGTSVASIGNLQTAIKGNLIPLNFNKNSSLCESVYLAGELGGNPAMITALSWNYSFVQTLRSKPVKIWMKNTTLRNMSSGWMPLDGYQLVFDGEPDFLPGENKLIIPLQIPFEYSGENLAIKTSRPLDSFIYQGNNHFYYNNLTSTPLRSRYVLSTNLDYGSGTTSEPGIQSSYVPAVSFSLLSPSPQELDTPILVINQEDGALILRWQSVPQALVYHIFASDDPQSWQDAPIFQTSQQYYLIPEAAPRMWYRVKAVR